MLSIRRHVFQVHLQFAVAYRPPASRKRDYHMGKSLHHECSRSWSVSPLVMPAMNVFNPRRARLADSSRPLFVEFR
jgi:hypothetical protein